MPLRPPQQFHLIVAAIVVALGGETALLWKLSQRPASPPVSVSNPSPTPAPTAPPLFTAPGIEPPPNPANPGAPPLQTAPRQTPAPPAVLGQALSPDARAQAKALFDAANVALRGGDKKGAIENFRRVVALAPDHLPTRLNLALLYLGEKRPAEAIPHLQKAAQIDPKNAAARFELARALLSLKRTGEAVAPLREVVRLAPKERAARTLLAQIYASQKQPALAYAQWTALAQSEARDVEAHLQAAGLAADVLKRPRDAEKWLRRAVAGSPRDPRAALLLGRFLLARKDAPGAAKTLAQIAKTRPDVFEIYPMLADARLASGDASGARDALQSAILRLPKGKTAADRSQIALVEGGLRLNLGRLWGQSKKPIQARREFERAAALLPRSAEARSFLAAASLQSGNRKAAIAALQNALAIDPKRLSDRRFLAQLLAQDKNWKAAAEQYAVYTKAQPRDGGAWLEWAQVASKAGQTEQELQILAKLTALQPKDQRLHLRRAVLLRDKKRPAAALASFQRALALKSDDPNVLADIARLQTQLQQPRQAAATWKKLIALRPDSVPAYRELLESSARAGDGALARLFLARQMSKPRENPRALSEVLRFYERNKQNTQAKAFLSDLVARNPKARFAKAALDSFDPVPVAPKPPTPRATPREAATPTPSPTAAPTPETPTSSPE